MVTLSGMWEPFPDETRHPRPLLSAGTLKIIGPVWISRDGTDRAKTKSETAGKKKNIWKGFEVKEKKERKRNKLVTPDVFLCTAAMNKHVSHTSRTPDSGKHVTEY